MLDPSNTTLSEELHITGLKILRKIIEASNTEVLTPSAEWENDDWDQ